MTTKTKTKKLQPKNYISDTNQLNLTRLVDDAVEALGVIRCCGVGRQRGRSRGVIFRSFRQILVQAGYPERDAYRTWQEQVVALDELNINAEE